VRTFSVVIPTYGRSEMLSEAVESVLAQAESDLEIIVVDDASPTPVSLPPHPQTTLLRAQHNSGPGGARNLGVDAAKGEYICFLDDDDLWLPNRLRTVADQLEPGSITVCWQSPRGRVLAGNVHDIILDGLTPHLGATVIHRDVWVPFDSTYRSCEDLVWWLDVSARARVSTVPVPCLEVRKHDSPRTGYGSDSRIANSKRMLEERAEYFNTHPRAAAFRWRRIGLMNAALERQAEARRAFLTALRLQPSLRDVKHLLWAATTRRG
jgi:glycosyltransferase involved in cell wall biosynthesis